MMIRVLLDDAALINNDSEAQELLSLGLQCLLPLAMRNTAMSGEQG
ncbi:hypothetical protein PMIT1303_00088 [Prochlorococcus sp. MIT 1303]|nr:hypothetical protein PMIT1303_00088 [Prochlorococcus sp. MIT 1303]